MNGWQCGIALAAMCVLPAAWPDAAQAQLSKERVPGGVEARPSAPAAPSATVPAPPPKMNPPRPLAPPAAAPATPPAKKPEAPKTDGKDGAASKSGGAAPPADTPGVRARGVKSGGDERKPGGVERGPNPQQ